MKNSILLSLFLSCAAVCAQTTTEPVVPAPIVLPTLITAAPSLISADYIKTIYTLTDTKGATLKEEPKEITIVRREAAQKNTGAQIGLNILMFALGSGGNIKTFKKEDLRGITIVEENNRINLQNTIPTSFLSKVNQLANDSIHGNADWKNLKFDKPLNIYGDARLIYENLTGEDDLFRMNVSLIISKNFEKSSFFGAKSHTIDCSNPGTEAISLTRWSENSYQLVSSELSKITNECLEKIKTEMPNLLKS